MYRKQMKVTFGDSDADALVVLKHATSTNH